jgi:hypothetical protein
MDSAYGYGPTRPAAQGRRGRENPDQNKPGGGYTPNITRPGGMDDGRPAGYRPPPRSGDGGGAPTGIPASPVLPNGQLSPQQVITGGAPQNPFTPPSNWVPGVNGNYVPPGHPNAAPGGVAGAPGGANMSIEGRQQALLNSILANPQVMGPTQIAGMRGAAQDDATSMLRDITTGIQQNAAGRGTLNGGVTAAMQAGAHQGVASDMLNMFHQGVASDMLNMFRDIETQAALQNRDSELAALQAAEDFINGRFGRQIGRDQLNLQRELGMGGLAIDRDRLTESGRQFNMGHQLNWAGLLNNMVMGRLGHGLDLAQLQQTGNANWLQQLLRGIGGGGS